MNEIKSNNNPLIKQIKKLLNYKKERLKKILFILRVFVLLKVQLEVTAILLTLKKLYYRVHFNKA